MRFAGLLFATGVLATAGCGSGDQRPLVLIDVSLGSYAAPYGTVDIKVELADGKYGVATFGTSDNLNGHYGVYLEEGGSGDGTATVEVRNADGCLLASGSGPVSGVSAGKIAGPFPVELSQSTVPCVADAGTDAADAAVADASPGVDGPPAVDSDAGRLEVSATGVDGADVAQPDLAADVPTAPDGLGVDAAAQDADRSADASEVATTTLDAGDTSEAGPGRAWQVAQNVENDQLNKSFYPSLVVDPVNEHVYVAWEESSAIKVKRWNRNTATWEKTVVIDSRGSPSTAKLGADAKGNVFLSWVQDATGADSTLYGVWISQTADGVSWTPPVHVASGKVYYEPQLAVARNGTARIVYTRQTASNIAPLFTAYYDGVAWTDNPTLIDAVDNGYGQDPRLAMDASGNAILLFDKYDTSSNTSIGAVTMTGATFSPAVILDTNTVSYVDVDQRSAAMNRKGEGVVVWSEYVDTVSYDMKMYARAYNPQTGWGSQSPTIMAAGEIYGVSAVLDESGVITIAWQQPTASGKLNTVAMRGSLTGAWSDVAVLETNNDTGNLITEFSHPQLALDASGNVLVAWRKEQKTADTTTFGAYASRYADGAWLPEFQLLQRTGYNVLTLSLSVADSGLGAAGFVFVSSTGSTADPDAYNTMVSFYR